MRLRDTENFKKGHCGELLVSEFLRRRGWFVIPSYDYSGEEGDNPPRLQGNGIAYPIPDLDVAKSGRRRWVEVKTKGHADWTLVTRRFEHGIAKRHYDAYKIVSEITGELVWLCVYEMDTSDVLIASLSTLKARFYEGTRMSRGGMVFFARDEFTFLFNLQNPLASERTALVPP